MCRQTCRQRRAACPRRAHLAADLLGSPGVSSDHGGRSATPERRCPVECQCDSLVAVTEGNEPEIVPERWNAAGAGSGMWMDMALDPRFAAGTEPEGERATLLDYLRAYRLAIEMKCAGLDAAQLARRSVPPSTMSLLGLIRHMADVERD